MTTPTSSPDRAVRIWYPISAWTIAVFTIFGNAILIYLVASRKQLRTSANWFVLSLSVADCFVGICFFPAYFLCGSSFSCGGVKSGHLMPEFFVWFNASVANVSAMVAERYVAVVWSLKYNTLMTEQRKKCLIVLSWLVPLLFCLTPFIFITSHETRSKWRVFLMVFITIFDILPSIALLVVTMHMFLISRKHSKEISLTVVQLNFNQPHGTAKVKIKTRLLESNHLRVVAAVVTVFVACNASISSFMACSGYGADCIKDRTTTACVIQILLLVNSALNPVAYSFFKSDIKKEVKRFFCCAQKSFTSVHRKTSDKTMKNQTITN